MTRKLLGGITTGLLAATLVVLFAFNSGEAHSMLTIGNYMVQYSWLHEPVIVNQPNALVFSILKVKATPLDGEAATQPESPVATPLANVAPAVTFLSPTTDTVVSGDVQVKVQLAGIDPTSNLYHWHLYLDGQLMIMSGVIQTGYTLPGIAPGTHVLTATLSGQDHVDLGTVATTRIEVNPTATNPVSETQTAGDPASLSENVLDLTVLLEYEANTQALYLEPSAVPGSNQFIARLTPTRAGNYQLRFRNNGQTATEEISAALEPVQGQNGLQYLANIFTTADLSILTLAQWVILALTVMGVFSSILGVLLLLVR